MANKVIKDIVNKSFPDGAQVVDVVSDVAPEERFWLIPGKAGPRWLIPQNIGYGIHVFKQWKPFDLLSRVKWKLLYGAYRAGLFWLIPGVTGVGITGCTSEQWEYLGWKDDVCPVPIIYIGTFSSTQKAVLFLVNPHSKKLASIAKIPLSEEASVNILHEYEILYSLAKEKPGIAPYPYLINREFGYSNQESIEGKLVGRKYSHKINVFLNGLKTKKKISIYDKANFLSEKLLKLENINNNLRILFFDVLKGLADTTELSAYYVHGDFVPWNIIEKADSSIVAVDWETADLNGLPLYDFFYFHFQQNYLFDRSISDVAPYGVLVKNLSYQIIGEIKKYTLVAMALNILSENGDASYFVDKLRKEV